MPIYAVMIRSGGKLSGIGAHSFAEALIEGAQVIFQGEKWTVEELDDEHSPPVVTLGLFR